MSEKRALTPEREQKPAEAARHVEPQPQSDEKRRAAEQSSDIDSYLRAVAGNITDNEVIEDLGRELGFSRGDIQNFIRTNYRDHEITSYGTFCMLRKWSERVSQSSLRSDLKEALKRAEERRTARAHLQSASISEGKSTCLTPDEVLQLKKELLRYYQRMYSAVRTSPLSVESSMSLDDIYTNLAMFSKGMKGEKTDMKYDDFIKHLENICANKESKNCIVLFGEAGVGKTTFLAKLTLGWASGKCLEAIDLLFLIPLKEIEENTSFGDIIMGKISDEVEFDGPRVEEYIRKNQRKVLILCDGLDEYSKDMDGNALKDDIIAVLTGNKYKCSPVVVTTRPWRAKEIKSNTELEKRYKFVEIEGFKKEDVNSYIAKYFPDNKEAKDGLIRLMTDKDSLVAENMAPFPIFCSMLCFIWQNEGSRRVIQGLETFAQLFEELIQHLNDHYAGKEKSQKKQAEKLKQGRDSLQQFGKDALYCLLKNKLVFGEEDLTTSPNDLKTVCEIGVLTREERFVRRRENRRRTEIVVEYQIPHKLFLEYLAGVHLAWLYGSNREEFNRINSEVMEEYESFEYLLYFTVAQNKEVGRDVIAALCQMHDGDLMQYDDWEYNFLVDVAFECHEKDAVEPMIPLLKQVSELRIARGHAGHGWIFVCKACDYLVIIRPLLQVIS
ncbi:NLR family CARD domain-containing protein 4-like [Diadema antillarum]|uniref:NLR family CARD domain-containing protein 4-like n=1 Tax=Diadema antillarum TaxID=105358 RepID=UPI003A861815